MSNDRDIQAKLQRNRPAVTKSSTSDNCHADITFPRSFNGRTITLGDLAPTIKQGTVEVKSKQTNRHKLNVGNSDQDKHSKRDCHLTLGAWHRQVATAHEKYPTPVGFFACCLLVQRLLEQDNESARPSRHSKSSDIY